MVVQPGVGGEPGLALLAREGELRGRRVRRRRRARGVRAAEVGREGGRGGEALAAQRAAVRAGQVGADSVEIKKINLAHRQKENQIENWKTYDFLYKKSHQ